MNILKLIFLYLISFQLAFAGKTQNSLISNYSYLTKDNSVARIKKVVNDFKNFKQVKDYLSVVHNPLVKTKINQYKNSQASRVIYKNGIILIRTNHLVNKMTVHLEDGYVTLNGKKIDLRGIKDSEKLWTEFEKVISKRTTSLFNLFIDQANAELVLISIAIISAIAVIDALVSSVSRNGCEERAKESLSSLTKVNSQCESDIANVMSSQMEKSDTETARYLQNIFSRIDTIRPNDFVSMTCEEAVENKFEYWSLYHFESCLKPEPGFNPAVTSEKLCDQIKKAEKCLDDFIELDPSAVTNSSYENSQSGGSIVPAGQNSSGSNQ